MYAGADETREQEWTLTRPTRPWPVIRLLSFAKMVQQRERKRGGCVVALLAAATGAGLLGLLHRRKQRRVVNKTHNPTSTCRRSAPKAAGQFSGPRYSKPSPALAFKGVVVLPTNRFRPSPSPPPPPPPRISPVSSQLGPALTDSLCSPQAHIRRREETRRGSGLRFEAADGA